MYAYIQHTRLRTSRIGVLLLFASTLAGCGAAGGLNESPVPPIQKPLLKAERVTRAQKLLAAGKNYYLGSADFVCDVLEINYRSENAIFADKNLQPASLATLSAGDVVAWRATSGRDPETSCLTAIYLGGPKQMFILVASPGLSPELMFGSQADTIYKWTGPGE